MNDAEYEAAKDRIEAIRQRWSKQLGLRWWRIEYKYYREGLPTKSSDAKDGYTVAANCDARWQYLDATIRFNVPDLADLSDEEIERVVVHEMMHVLVNEARETGEGWLAHEERVCSSLTSAFIWLRDMTREESTEEPSG